MDRVVAHDVPLLWDIVEVERASDEYWANKRMSQGWHLLAVVDCRHPCYVLGRPSSVERKPYPDYSEERIEGNPFAEYLTDNE